MYHGLVPQYQHILLNKLEVNKMRTGRDYLERIQDNRTVYINGEKVENVVTHPAFEGVTKSVAKLYDIASEERELMTFVNDNGVRANKIFMIPKKREDLAARRKAIQRWAEETNGLIGRSPDHVASFFAGFASKPSVFEKGGKQYKDNLLNFYNFAMKEDLYLSYVIIPPQIDRSKSVSELNEDFLATGVYRETDDGIYIRGSQMLGTSAAISDYLFVSCITPLKEGDEKYALSFVVPVGASGLKFYARPSYAMNKSSEFDYPLSTNFDESDALVVFEDVFIPWEHVFIYQNIQLVKEQFFVTPAHTIGNTQSQVRLSVKLKFAIGLAYKVAQLNGSDKIPAVQEKLGDLASLAATVEGMLLASEYECTINEDGVAVPNKRYLYAVMGMQNSLYSNVIHLIRELVGGGVLQVPSSYKELVGFETKNDLEKYIKTSNRNTSAVEKVKIFKLVWDFIGSEFGSRHEQYEMFYSGAPHITRANAFRNYGYEEPLALVDNFLAKYDLPIDVYSQV